MSVPYNYKFGGKELQETGFYDFGARMLMPDLGRWFNIDSLAELRPDLTPFRYAFNNPISFTDPNGMYEGGGGDWDDDYRDSYNIVNDGCDCHSFWENLDNYQIQNDGPRYFGQEDMGSDFQNDLASEYLESMDEYDATDYMDGTAEVGTFLYEYFRDQEDPRNPNNKNITFLQARENYLSGSGEKFYQDIQSMGVVLHNSDFDKHGIAIINYDLTGFNGIGNALVVGKLAFQRVPGNPEYAQVVFDNGLGCRCELYDFNMEPTRGSLRNALTAIGSLINSSYNNGLIIAGRPFPIQYNNVVKISK